MLSNFQGLMDTPLINIYDEPFLRFKKYVE